MKWLYNILKKKYQYNLEIQPVEGVTSRRIDSHGINFTVHRATGGFIVEYHQFNRENDRSEHTLHIVREEEDLGNELSKIISFQSLKY
jgi:hypothetical protein